MWWNPQQWAEVVERTPLVSIDLVVPGGVVRKGETLQQAFQRLLLLELGVQVKLARANLFAGVYEHHYPDNFAGTEGVGTHYVVLAHRLNAEQHLPGLGGLNELPKAQHNDYVWMPVAELLNNPQVHEHTKAYFQE